MRILSYRPGVISNGTAFEAMASTWKYLQEHEGYDFTVVKSVEDGFQDASLSVVSIPRGAWEPTPYVPLFPRPWMSGKHLDPLLAWADGVLADDPTIFPQSLLIIGGACRLGKPVWLDASSTVLGLSRGIEGALRRRAVRRALRQVVGITVTVPKSIERFRDIGLFDEEIAAKFVVMGHPVNTGQFVPRPKPSQQDGVLRVLAVSRMVPEKGLLYILEAMTPLLRERADRELILLGHGPMLPLLRREVKERGLDSRVRFADPVPHAELAQILGAADIFVSHAVGTSHWEEFFGVANLEAMSCGLPCVLTACGGISYVVREKGVATFVEQRNVVELREAITQLVASRAMRLEMGQAAREYVERRYSLPVIAGRYHQMLQRGIELRSAL